MPDSSQETSGVRNALSQVTAVTVKNMLLMSFGMTTGYPTILIPGLSPSQGNDDISLDQEGLSWIGSIAYMCVPIGCVLSGLITQPLGRKRTMQIVSVPLLMSWIIVRYSIDPWQIYLALGLMGLAGGLLEAPVLTYVAEVTQPHMRGLLGATSTMFVFLGVLIEFFLGAFLDWRTVALYSCFAPFMSFVLLFLIPESPHWLIMKNRLDEARKSLAWLRGWTSVSAIEHEFQEISYAKRQQLEETVTNRRDVFKPYLKRRFFHPLVFVSFVFFLAHFSGITTLTTYAVPIFETLQTPVDKYYATILLGAAQFLGCAACVTLVHPLGKRVLTCFSMVVGSICITVTATYAHLIGARYFDANSDVQEGDYKWIPLICIVLTAFMLQCGIRNIPWILVGEVFSSETRAFGAGLLAGIGYIFGFITNKIFLQTVSAITFAGMFWVYAGINLVGIIILHFWLPETEGKTLLEITEHYAGKKKLSNEVRRTRKERTPPCYVNEGFESKSVDNLAKEFTNTKI